jgi:hypothetical protein
MSVDEVSVDEVRSYRKKCQKVLRITLTSCSRHGAGINCLKEMMRETSDVCVNDHLYKLFTILTLLDTDGLQVSILRNYHFGRNLFGQILNLTSLVGHFGSPKIPPGPDGILSPMTTWF